MNGSVRPSVCFSVRLSHLFTMYTSPYYHEILWGIKNGRSDVHAKGQGQKSKVKVTEVKAQFCRFRTVTTVWIHIWQWNDAQSFVLPRRGTLFFVQGLPSNFKFTRLSKSSILTWIEHFGTVSQVWICRWFWNDAQGSKQHRRGSLLFFKVIQPIARSHGTKKSSILILMERVRTVAQVSIHRCLCTKLNVVSERCSIVFQGHPPNFKFTMDKKSQILTRIECFRTVTVWIHPWF